MRYEVVDQTTQVTSEHTRILLSNDDLLVAAQHFLCVLRQRVDESEVGMSDLVALLTDLMGSFVEVPIGTPSRRSAYRHPDRLRPRGEGSH